ncbi:probable glutamate receptor [Palaemon carinicauda]|uniref:probable glutamate receptor n=1 Tax=Palaemon carinicauda TaxID=392227 RepID=UPI0035B5F4AD
MGWSATLAKVVFICRFIAGLVFANEVHEGTNSTCLRVVVETWAPYMEVIGTTPPFQRTGIIQEVLDIVSMKLKRCIEYSRPKERGLGFQLPNGTWIGLLGVLVQKEADFSGVILSVNEYRIRYVDFSTPLFMDEKILSYKRPEIEPDTNGMFKPFTPELWLFLCIAFLTVCAVTYFIYRNDPTGAASTNESTPLTTHRGSDEDRKVNESSLRGLWYSCLWTSASLIAQSCYWCPRGNSVRIITGLWLLLCLVVNTVYRSNLKAMLILPKVPLPFNNMEELVQSGIKTYMPAQSVVYDAMMNAPPGSALSRLQKQAVVHFDHKRATMETLKGVTAAFIGRLTTRYLLHQGFELTGKCPLYIASETFFGATTNSIAFAKGSPLQHQVNPILLKLKESGILDHLHDNALANSRFCSKQRNMSVMRSLELGDFYGVLLIYLGGNVFLVLQLVN